MTPAPNATLDTLLALVGADGSAEQTVKDDGGSTPPAANGGGGRTEPLPKGYVAKLPLGAGSAGAVWLATETALDRDVAVKVLHADGSHVAHASLLAEAKVLAKLEHPAIPPIYALGDSDGAPFVAMRRIDGSTLRDLSLDLDHPLWTEWSMGTGDRWVAVVEILARVAEALAHAHARGLVHRDVKPANIVVGSLGQAFLVDWGLAVPVGTLASTAVAGTPAFLAPEMVLGGIVDARTDVYLLGATLHAALTGDSRHTGETIQGVLLAASRSEPVEYDPSLPVALAALANAATAKDPAARPETALAFRDALRAYRRDRMADGFVKSADGPLLELEALVGRSDDEALANAERLASVCRFVYRHASELAATASASDTGPSRVASAMARFYLARGEAGPARAALADVQGADRDDIARAIADLEAAKENEAARVYAMTRALREQDPNVEARGRPWLVAAFAAAAAVCVVVARLLVVHDEPDYPRMIAVGSGFAVVALIIIVAFAKQLRSSHPNRAIAGVILVAAFGRVALRFLDHAYGVQSLVPSFGRELIVLTCLWIIAAIGTRVAVFWAVAAPFAVGSVACGLFPHRTLTIFDATLAAAFAAGIGAAAWIARHASSDARAA